MAAFLFGTTGLSWGIASAETGILVQSYARTISGSEKLAKNNVGETVGVSLYDQMAEHVVEGYDTGSTGIAAASFGVALTIANVISGNGVAAGLVICTGFSDKLANEDYKTITATCKQWPLVTAAVV